MASFSSFFTLVELNQTTKLRSQMHKWGPRCIDEVQLIYL
eukprot:UN14835